MKNPFISVRAVWLAVLTLGLFGRTVSAEKTVVKTEQEQAIETKQSEEAAICPVAEETPDKIVIKNDPDEPLIDPNRFLKDVNTKFVVDHFFTTKESLYNFMKLTYQTIDNDLKEYRAKNNLDERAIYFLFKGGNVMRLLANGIFKLLPPEAREYLKTNYEDIFKRSDADFSVFVDDKRLNDLDYETVMNELTEVAYKSLVKIRDAFYANPDKYFDFGRLQSNDASALLAKTLSNLNKPEEGEGITDPENELWYKAKFLQYQMGQNAAKPNTMCTYLGQRDIRFLFNQDKTEIIGTAITDETGPIQITLNRSLEWSMQNNKKNLIKFHLVRAKIGFEFTFEKSPPERKIIGGELIDVSFPHRDDFRLRHFLDNYEAWVSDYTLSLNENEVLSFKAESIEGIAADIADILFRQQDRPWNDPKYEKRIRRLFFFGTTDIMKTMGIGSEKIASYVDAIKQKVITPLRGIYVDNKISTETAQEAVASTKEIVGNYPELVALNNLFTDTVKLPLEKMAQAEEGDENFTKDQESFSTYLEVLVKNLDIISKLGTMTQAVIDPTEAYKATIEDLL